MIFILVNLNLKKFIYTHTFGIKQDILVKDVINLYLIFFKFQILKFILISSWQT